MNASLKLHEKFLESEFARLLSIPANKKYFYKCINTTTHWFGDTSKIEEHKIIHKNEIVFSESKDEIIIHPFNNHFGTNYKISDFKRLSQEEYDCYILKEESKKKVEEKLIKESEIDESWKTYKLKESDLKGCLKGYPLEIAQYYYDQCVKYGTLNDKGFITNSCNSGCDRLLLNAIQYHNTAGFTWVLDTTVDWREIRVDRNFSSYYKKYPKETTESDEELIKSSEFYEHLTYNAVEIIYKHLKYSKLDYKTRLESFKQGNLVCCFSFSQAPEGSDFWCKVEKLYENQSYSQCSKMITERKVKSIVDAYESNIDTSKANHLNTNDDVAIEYSFFTGVSVDEFTEGEHNKTSTLKRLQKHSKQKFTISEEINVKGLRKKARK